jgi:SAM-dependent methyltransferase
MAIEVLKNRCDIDAARREMKNRGIDCADHCIKRLLKRWCILPGITLGDSLKSWDVMKTINFLGERVSYDAPLLDLGAYASEILPALHRLGFSNLTGIDLNTRLSDMPYRDKIRYVVENIYETSFENASFAALTAISVIEHGFDSARLLSEVSRLLKLGGYFVASVDYWPEKIDTHEISAFGMGWTIFSRNELMSFSHLAREYGLELCGETSFDAERPTVTWLGKSYTFAWIALRKTGEGF